MTPKEKAEEIVEQMSDFIPRYDHNEENINIETIIRCAKQCALIAVDEMLKTNWINVWEKEYWQEVKQEIEKF